ncbi:MAG: TIGR04086 family membrane protein, partial [Firmicutes bacterium]|nr:TIGR04086 family membrane protein [Bacillota bacterium]
IVYHFTSISEQSLPWGTAMILAASAFGGSLTAGREAGNKGLYHGLAVGLTFFIIVWAGAGLLMPGLAVIGLFYKLLIIASAGALGGVLGVGLS